MLSGLTGPIEVGGANDSATMPPFGHLDDAEIAAVFNYVRSAWGNVASGSPVPLDAKAIAALRAPALTWADVHAYREQSKRPQ